MKSQRLDLLVSVLMKSEGVFEQITEERKIRNELAQTLTNHHYKYAIAGDDVFTNPLKGVENMNLSNLNQCQSYKEEHDHLIVQLTSLEEKVNNNTFQAEDLASLIQTVKIVISKSYEKDIQQEKADELHEDIMDELAGDHDW
ncbi:hypothetical protein ACFYKX_11465 [Cytobacillus sp. FJAT-54145]|uniref:Uncharacterized protein n=1 Tax=Cytobacillus spartinae TaxID=3299023 RepID=A0ABW6KBW4_9BACI